MEICSWCHLKVFGKVRWNWTWNWIFCEFFLKKKNVFFSGKYRILSFFIQKFRKCIENMISFFLDMEICSWCHLKVFGKVRWNWTWNWIFCEFFSTASIITIWGTVISESNTDCRQQGNICACCGDVNEWNLVKFHINLNFLYLFPITLLITIWNTVML